MAIFFPGFLEYKKEATHLQQEKLDIEATHLQQEKLDIKS